MIASDLADRCPLSHLIESYAECKVDDEQAARIEEHLMGCNCCSERLAQAVDSGVLPAWLPTLINNSPYFERPPAEGSEAASIAHSVDAIETGDRYQKLRLQGEGGMGQVWQGWDAVMKRRVALKQLRSAGRNPDRVQRLLQEATSLARLSHPNIVAVHEVLILSEQPTIVMEFVDGPTLADISRDFVMSERQAAKIMERLADAIAHAHEQGVIHRDLKPSNVLLHWPGETFSHARKIDVQSVDTAIPKLTDFGMAKTLESEDLTHTGDLLGTPAYMAPEQTIGLAGVAGSQVDVYGLGAILYDLLTGKPPHVAENPVTTILSVREREPSPPRLLRPEISKDIETICLKCLQKSPKDRYSSAHDLRRDLLAFLDGQPIIARPLGPIRTAIRWSRRHKALVACAVLAASLMLTLVVGSLWTASNERQLRVAANEAKMQAERSEKKFSAEAERANKALDVNRAHFDVALDRVNRLAHLAYNPHNKTQSELDYNLEIREATKDIYATYLDTLPAPEAWTLNEAYAVTFYVKYITALGRSDLAALWLERMTSVVPRLEAENSDSPKMRKFLAQHYTNASIRAYANKDFDGSGRYAEQAGAFVDVDARQAAYMLMCSALSFKQAGSREDSIRAANKSVSAYRTAMAQPDPNPDDSVNLLENLKWHRHVAQEAGDAVEADKNLVEFDELAGQFDPSSPYYNRVQGLIRDFHNQP